MCYASTTGAYVDTICTTTQIQNDAAQTGACAGAMPGYTYYCPASGLLAGTDAGSQTCGVALRRQVGAAGLGASSVVLSSATCSACGAARHCPLTGLSYTSLDPRWWGCVKGGSTDTLGPPASVAVQFCTIRPTSGFYAIVILLPLLGLFGAVMLCCRLCSCCPWNRAIAAARPKGAQGIMLMTLPQPQMVMVQQPVVMTPMEMAAAPVGVVAPHELEAV